VAPTNKRENVFFFKEEERTKIIKRKALGFYEVKKLIRVC